MALTAMNLKFASYDSFIKLCYARPAIAIAMMSLSEQKHAYVTERLVDIGRRTPLERVANFILEIRERLRAAGYAIEKKFEIPLSQEVIADSLGLSATHVNRMLRQMREAKLITMHKHSVTLLNPTELDLLAKHDQPFSAAS